MANIKISELTAKSTNLLATDLLEVSEVSGLTYVSKKITGQQIIDGIGLSNYVPYTGASANVNLGEYEIKVGQLTLDTSPTGTAAVGTTRWNDSLGSTETTLKGGSVILKNGVDLVARIVNKVTPNTTLTKAAYPVVKVSGAQGQRLAVAYAQANNDNNSADTLGVVTETIATNQEGFIITVGQLENINTTGSLQGETWADGDVLYLSPTIPGAITKVKPTGATGHIVIIGYVEYAHANNGKIYVKIMNGWELDELHNVYINPATLANNDALIYESSTQLWKNKTIAQALGYTPVTNARTITINGTTQDLSADRTFTVSSGISVGSTTSSGVDGRVFFQAGGVVQQSDRFTFDNTTATNILQLGAGANLGVSLRTIAPGATSSDIAFRVRNSADTQNIARITGDSRFILTQTSLGVDFLSINQSGASSANDCYLDFASGRGIRNRSGVVQNGIRIFANSTARDTGVYISPTDSSSDNCFYFDGGQNLRIGQGLSGSNQPDANATRTILQINGTAPTTSVADGFQQYSADITSGNAAPHFRTENGSIVKLYQETAVTTSQGIATALASQGLLATSTIVPTVQSVTSAATVTPVAGNEEVVITAQAAALTIANPTGTWYQGQDLIIRIKDNGTGRAITWDTNYRAIGVTLPTTTVANKLTYVGVIYNSTDSKWDVIGVSQEA